MTANYTTVDAVDFFESCGYGPDDLISVCWSINGRFGFTFATVAEAPIEAAKHAGGNVWFGTGILRGRPAEGRGSNEDTARMPCLFADIDFEAGSKRMPSEQSAWDLVDEVSSLIGADPVAVVSTGGGLHPRWLVDGDLTQEQLELFGVLVGRCAERLGGEVDSVYDFARILRAPGTFNHKYDGKPRPVVAFDTGGSPLSVDQLLEAFDAYSIELPSPTLEALPEGTGPIERERGDRYVRGALQGIRSELAAAATWPEGYTEHNRGWEKLTADVALRLGSLVKAPWNSLSTEQAAAFLDEHAPIGGNWTKRDVAGKWRSQFARAAPAKQPADLQGDANPLEGLLADWAPSPQEATEGGGAGSAAAHGHSLAEGDQAGAFAASYLAGRWCWNKSMGWLQWTGQVWTERPPEIVRELARKHYTRWNREETVRLLGKVEGIYENLGKDDKKLLGSLHSTLSRKFLDNVVSLCGPLVEVRVEEFNTRPDLLNVGNGVVNLATGELLAHAPSYYLTKITQVEYHPEQINHPMLIEAMGAFSCPEVADWMQLRFGQSATGKPPPDDLLLILKGSGENGKSTVMSGVQHALGQHATLVDDKVLLSDPNTHSTERTALHGARFALIEEVPGGRELDMNKVKKITGSVAITARKMRMDSIEWMPTHTLFVTTNHSLVVKDTDHGSWRRLALVDFPYRFRKAHEPLEDATDRRGDPRLRQAIESGEPTLRQAFLAWIVAGARRFYDMGEIFPEPPLRVINDTNEWRGEVDLVLSFINDHLIFDADSLVISTELYETFVAEMSSHQNRAWSPNTFMRNFMEHSRVRKSGTNVAAARTRSFGDLSRPSRYNALNLPSGPTKVIRGVRFRTASDDAAQELAGRLSA